MFHNLNLPSAQRGQLTEVLVAAEKLRFDVVAINRTVTVPVTAEHTCSKQMTVTLENSRASVNSNLLRVQPRKPNGRTQQLTRLTIIMNNDSLIRSLDIAASALQSYDLVAVRPMTETAFRHVCNDAEVDIISFDLSERLPVQFKHKIVGVALKRGLTFEIDIAPALRDVTARRNLIANALLLARITKGHGLIITCSATSPIELRGPYDLINLAMLCGLGVSEARAAVVAGSRRAVMHGISRRSARGVLLVKPIDDDNAWMTPNVNNTTATTTTTTSTTTTLLIDEALPDDVEEDEDDANSTFNVDTTISTNSNNDDMRDNVTQSAKRRKA